MGLMGPMGPGGFRRRGRRRGLIVGAAAGASVAKHAANKQQQSEQADNSVVDEGGNVDYEAELVKLKDLREKDLISDEEYQKKKDQVLGV